MELAEVPLPKFGSGEVLVKIIAAGLNPVDWKIRLGLLKGRMPHQFPIIPGWEASGIVEAVGSEVIGFRKGDEVFAYTRKEKIQDGTYAEFIALEPRHLALKPKNLRFEEAAAIPLAGLTAYQSLFESLKIKKGETILIHAGAGGVGGYAIQLAKNSRVKVITTASSRNHQYVQQLGADKAIDYTKKDFVQAVLQDFPQGIDAVFDTVGGEFQKKSAGVLKKGGRLTSILEIDQDYFSQRGITPGYVFVRPEPDHLNQLRELAEAGKLTVHLHKLFSLDQVREAHREIETGHVRGKIILSLV
ncbi:MAG: NADP-dependent oxidoreductase [Deltaproteobacteria bacterium]|nr:NADP-dependent oxidoreductase [Deltaproteobacteria bacterium]